MEPFPLFPLNDPDLPLFPEADSPLRVRIPPPPLLLPLDLLDFPLLDMPLPLERAQEGIEEGTSDGIMDGMSDGTSLGASDGTSDGIVEDAAPANMVFIPDDDDVLFWAPVWCNMTNRTARNGRVDFMILVVVVAVVGRSVSTTDAVGCVCVCACAQTDNLAEL